MSTRILILKDGVITPSKSSTDNTAIVNSLGSSLVTSVNGSTGVITLTKSSIGLNLVDNTSDLNKPVSTAQQTALDLKANISSLSSKADLVGGLIPSSQLPSYVDDVLEFASSTNFPNTGETGKIYVAIDTNLVYRWTGSIYSIMSASLALGTTSTTAYRGDFGNTAYNHSQIVSGNPHGVTAALINLGNVNNTSDLSKPISTATQTALDLKAPLLSPSLTGTPTAPTAVAGTNTTQIATTAFVINAVASGGSTTSFVDLTTAQTITGLKTFNGGLQLSSTAGTSVGTIWRNVDNLEYKDSANITKILLNSAGNLSNLSNKQTALNNLVQNQTANRVLRSNGVNVVLAQVGLTTDVVDVLPVINGGTGSPTQNWVDLTSSQSIAGVKVFNDPTESTSTTTGGTRCLGGFAVAKNISIGGRIIQTINYTFRAGAATSQALTSGTWNKINLGTESQDSNNQYTPASSRLTAITTETWRLTVFITLQLATASRILLSVWKNGAEVGGTSRLMDMVANAGDFAISLNLQEFPLVANDYIELYCFSSAAATVFGEANLIASFWSGKRIN